MQVIICRDCDTVYRSVALRRGESAICRRCGASLARHCSANPETGLALTLSAAILFGIANLTPILTIEVAGVETRANIWYAVLAMHEGWISVAALGLALTTFLIPIVQILLLLWILMFISLRRRPPAFRHAMRLLHALRPWSMTEVFLLGALVAVAKLGSWVPIGVGAGIWALAGLTVMLALLGRCDTASWWSIEAKSLV
jgi:paraquat-inducible protein A